MSTTFRRYFLLPTIISFICFFAVWLQAGTAALLLVVMLSVLEVTLSFDNAVVNAKILEKMSAKWQRRFLTWGILVAVLGTRLLLPIVIVSITVWISPLTVAGLALHQPDVYGALLEHEAGSIAAFGGIFLLMVSLKYFFDSSKSIHWITIIERHLVKWGRLEAIEIAIAIVTIITLSYFTHHDQSEILIAGFVGLLLFILMEGITSTLSIEGGAVVSGGLALFVYLNILDSAFSLDGVVGAFALSTNLLIIMTGLGIGAYFVRSLTLLMVNEHTLTHLRYLEQGAHWAILGLAGAMLTNLVIPVPELITGSIGLLCVSLAYRASLKAVLE